MKLDILFEAQTLDEIKNLVNLHFKQQMTIHQEKISMFEQYRVTFRERFEPEIWKYRIVCRNGKYYFGVIDNN